MEYAEGGDLLARVINHGCFSECDTRKLIEQLLLAIDFMHKKNFIHRDLKLQNVLLFQGPKEDIDLRLADFGLAEELIAPDQSLTRKCGSPGYTAPEILRGEPYTLKADIFSIGSILFSILTGKSLFPGEDMAEIVHNNKHRDLTPI